MGDVLQRVLDGMGEGVHRVDAPLVAGVVVLGMTHAVDGGITQIDVGRCHVDLCAQHGSAIGQLAVAHFAKARQVLGHRAAAERAVHAGAREIAAVGLHVVGALLVHIGQALLDQVLGRAVHEVEVVAGEVQVLVTVGFLPAEAQPMDGIDDAVHVLLVFLLGIGVVEAQVAGALVVARQAEVQADGLGVAHVQVAVGLGREACADLRHVHLALVVVVAITGASTPAALGVGTVGQVGLDDLAQKVTRFDRIFGDGGGVSRAHRSIVGARLPTRSGRLSDSRASQGLRHLETNLYKSLPSVDPCRALRMQGVCRPPVPKCGKAAPAAMPATPVQLRGETP